MEIVCFNCDKKISEQTIICPNCFVVQKNRFNYNHLSNYLEKKFPTKPVESGRFVSTKVVLNNRKFEWWLLLGIFTLGFGYLYYLLLTLNDMNNHWKHPHGNYESTTKTDVFISMIILIFTNLFGVPIIQYIRYSKLRKHLLNAPPESRKNYPIRGKTILLLYISLVFLIVVLGNMLFFGLSSILADLYFQFNTSQVAVLFFSIASVIFTLAILLAILLIALEMRWQENFNYHINWHIKYKKAIKRRIHNNSHSQRGSKS